MHVGGLTLARTLSFAHGGYYLVTGLWPILHLRSFETITGPKSDGWLVKTLGGVIAVVGGVMMLAGMRRKVSPELRWLGLGSAAAFGVADLLYPLKGRVSKMYLVDALPQCALAAGWAVASTKRAREKHAEQAREYEAVLLGEADAEAAPSPSPV